MITVTVTIGAEIYQDTFRDCYIVQQPECTGFTKEHLVIAKDSDNVSGYSIVSVYAPGSWLKVMEATEGENKV